MDKMAIVDILRWLESEGKQENRDGMARFGINIEKAYGVSMPALRSKAAKLGRSHELALALWDSAAHEARILACLVDDPKKVTEDQMEYWASGFNSWDLCDQCCSNLFDRTQLAYRKAEDWSFREEEYVKRAGFVLMAALSVHDKKADDVKFLHFLDIIYTGADDDRNFVKKAVNWALRQIGKRNKVLNAAAIETAKKIGWKNSRSARWIASDALRELANEKVRSRLE
jgi:3-methyladenine DNA glycosylase AlkD